MAVIDMPFACVPWLHLMKLLSFLVFSAMSQGPL